MKNLIKSILREYISEGKKIEYTDQELYDIAKKYNHRGDFLKNDRMAYIRAKERGILADITKHMTHKGVKWTREKLKEIISKYKNVPDFRKYDNAAYQAAYYQGILDDLIKDLERGGSRFQKIVYAYEFPDNSVYVGLTYNTKMRDWDHRTNPNSQVYKHIMKTNSSPELKFLTTSIPWNEAKDLEGKFEKEYQDKGWNVLNVATTGGLGRTIVIYSDEKIKEAAAKYNRLKDFRDKSPGEYRAAQKRGKDFFFDVTKHMDRDKYSFSDEELETIAAFYDTKYQFEKNDRNAYRQAVARGKDFYDRITAHMKKINEQTEPPKGECGITRACSKEEAQAEKEQRGANKQAAAELKADQKYFSQQNKLALDMDYDIDNQRRTRESKNNIKQQFDRFKNNPLLQGGSYRPEQKFSVLYKVLEFMKSRPQLSYSTRLQKKFQIPNPKAVTLEELAGYANQLGWDKFIQWFQAGGPELK